MISWLQIFYSFKNKNKRRRPAVSMRAIFFYWMMEVIRRGELWSRLSASGWLIKCGRKLAVTSYVPAGQICALMLANTSSCLPTTSPPEGTVAEPRTALLPAGNWLLWSTPMILIGWFPWFWNVVIYIKWAVPVITLADTEGVANRIGALTSTITS